MIYTGRVLHGGGANTTTDQWRYGLHLSYVLGWLTPEEAGRWARRGTTCAHLSERAQRLLGWRCSAVNDDVRRPAVDRRLRRRSDRPRLELTD